ncbi:MAG: response regulator [Holophaga sp.]|nr:response regulator [Holophaga sp.]
MTPPIIPAHLPAQRLLLVDDDPLLLATLRELLDGEGFQVAAAGSGEEAEILLRQAQPPFELVLTDMVMPGQSGMDVLRTALQLNPSCTVLVLSGFGTLREATAAMDQGAYGLVNKPLQMEAFRQTLRRIVERTHLIVERDALKSQVRELTQRVEAMETIQGRMEMLAQVMTPEPADPGRKDLKELQDLAALHTRGQLTDEEFETAKKSLLSKWLS